MSEASVPSAVRWLLRAQCVALVVFAGLLVTPVPGVPPVLRDMVLGNIVFLLPLIATVMRGWLVRLDRAWAWSLAAGIGSYLAGNLVFLAWTEQQNVPTFPSWADAGYLCFYPFAVLAILLSMRTRLGGLQASVLLDGLVGGLAAATAAACALGPLLGTFHGVEAPVVVAAAYPAWDTLIIAMVFGVFSATGGRPGGFYLCFSAGLVVFAVADAVYSYRAAFGLYSSGTPLDALWAAGLALMAYGVWRPGSPRLVTSKAQLGSLWVVVVSSAVAMVALVTASQMHLSEVVVGLALGTLLAGSARTALAFVRLRDLAGAQRLALTDDLTGLPNRRALYDRVDRAMDDRESGPVVVGLVLLDLDRFKEVNDSFGHQAGDRLLQLVTERLATALEAFGSPCLLSRLGGDEFAVLVPTATVPEEVTAVAEHLRDALHDPIKLEGLATLHVRASTGVAVAPLHAENRTDLMRCADMAMYAAKGMGSAGVRLYHPDLAVDHRDSLTLAEDLRAAIDNNELTLDYQPQVDLRGGVHGFEALARWNRANWGPVAPDAFLRVAEDHHLMPALTRSVLNMAVRDCAAWRRRGFDVTVSVNLSASDLHNPGLPALVGETLDEHDMPADSLILEITETNVMTDPARAEFTLVLLHELGVLLSVDDYGTGHCSLSYLRHLPVQELKLDRSFVRDVASEPYDEAIMRSSVDLAHSLGMRIVAEGVEDADAARLLEDAGCDLAQGWYLGLPMPLADILTWLGPRQPRNRRPNPQGSGHQRGDHVESA